MRVFDIGGPESPREASDRVLTIPESRSASRVSPCFPLVLLDLLEGRFGRALVFLLLIGASDWFDGYLARVLDQRTLLGAVLDPIGDRVVFVVVGVGLVLADLLPLWVLVVLLARELAVLVVGLVLLLAGRSIPETSRLGKVATVRSHALDHRPRRGPPRSATARRIRWDGSRSSPGEVWRSTSPVTYLATLGYARAALRPRS